MVNSNVELVLTPEKRSLHLLAKAMFFLAWATHSNTNSLFRVVQNANTFTTGNRGINPSEGVSETSDLCSVVDARSSTYKRRGSHVTRRHKIRT